METQYAKYKKMGEWKVVDKAIKDLIKNGDINLLTPQEYVTGYICSKLKEKKPLKGKV